MGFTELVCATAAAGEVDCASSVFVSVVVLVCVSVVMASSSPAVALGMLMLNALVGHDGACVALADDCASASAPAAVIDNDVAGVGDGALRLDHDTEALAGRQVGARDGLESGLDGSARVSGVDTVTKTVVDALAAEAVEGEAARAAARMVVDARALLGGVNCGHVLGTASGLQRDTVDEGDAAASAVAAVEEEDEDVAHGGNSAWLLWPNRRV